MSGRVWLSVVVLVVSCIRFTVLHVVECCVVRIYRTTGMYHCRLNNSLMCKYCVCMYVCSVPDQVLSRNTLKVENPK